MSRHGRRRRTAQTELPDGLPASALRHPSDYGSTVAYHRYNNTLGLARIVIGLWCWLHGVAAVLVLSATTIESSVSNVVAASSALTTVFVGAAWVRGPWPNKRHSLAFLGYAEIGVGAVLLSIDVPMLALPAAALLTVVGSYAVVFHGPLAFGAHSAYTLSICVALYVRVLADERTDEYVATAYMVILMLVLFGTPALLQILMTLLRADAASASYDPLTGLRNRRGLDAALQDLMRTRAARLSLPEGGLILTAAVIDIDRFKAINDQYGHSVGDTVLRTVADRLRTAFPAPAITARVGGEEFAVITLGALPSAELVGALGEAIGQCGTTPPVTASAGVAELRTDPRTLATSAATVLQYADDAMYVAKRAGGDRIADTRDAGEAKQNDLGMT